MSGACASCGAVLEGDPRACPSCGEALLKTCPFCGEETPGLPVVPIRPLLAGGEDGGPPA